MIRGSTQFIEVLFSTIVLIVDTVNKETNITNRTEIENPNW